MAGFEGRGGVVAMKKGTKNTEVGASPWGRTRHLSPFLQEGRSNAWGGAGRESEKKERSIQGPVWVLWGSDSSEEHARISFFHREGKKSGRLSCFRLEKGEASEGKGVDANLGKRRERDERKKNVLVAGAERGKEQEGLAAVI